MNNMHSSNILEKIYIYIFMQFLQKLPTLQTVWGSYVEQHLLSPQIKKKTVD
jgi:hypothetical protein